ncbi:MAG: hypothetical protein ACYS6K_28480, partial [Planctomycetota bacterium]
NHFTERPFGEMSRLNRLAPGLKCSPPGGMVNGIPMVAELERDPFEIIETGDHVYADADNGTLTVTKKNNINERR